MDAELRARCVFARQSKINPTLWQQILTHFGSFEQALSAPAQQWVERQLPPLLLQKACADTADADFNWLEASAGQLLWCDEPDYPQLLGQIPDAPVRLYLQGSVEALHWPQLAMVGSRNPSVTGRQTAERFARSIAQAGLAVTSGLALGVDGAAHQAVVDGNDVTVAVAGTGLDRVYPARHRQLAHDIVACGGALVSEYPPGTGVRPYHFPRRNRIIAGMSLGTLVVEAAPKSGSLITARLAAEYGREVFAIPGSIHNPLAKGCHALIKQGAKLVETADDVLLELTSMLQAQRDALSEVLGRQLDAGGASNSSEAGLTDIQPEDIQATNTGLLRYIGFEPTSLDTLVERSGLSVAEISYQLSLLEMDQQVVTTAGGYMRCQ